MDANNPASVNSNTILAYKLLADAWGDDENNVFKNLMKNEMKFLASGISLLQNDPYLQMHFGTGLNGAEKIAAVLQSKVGELNVKQRLEPTAKTLLDHQFANPHIAALKQGATKAAKLATNGTLVFNAINPYKMAIRKLGGDADNENTGLMRSDDTATTTNKNRNAQAQTQASSSNQNNNNDNSGS